MTYEVVLAVAAGVAFSAVALAYRAGAARGIPTCFVALGMGLAGVAWFWWRAFAMPDGAGLSTPMMVWTWGIVNGLAQGFCVYLFRAGLRYGPLAPLWCAGNLVFVTPALFSLLILDEHLNGAQVAGMLAALACVVTASMGHGAETQQVPLTLKQKLLYLGMLTILVIFTGLCGVALKHMAGTEWQGAPMNPRFNDSFMLGMYATLLLFVAGEAAVHKRPAAGIGRTAGYAALAGGGSVIGMTLTSLVSRMPGGIGFALIAVSAVLAGAFITSFGFGEQRGTAWWTTVGLAASAVVLFNWATG